MSDWKEEVEAAEGIKNGGRKQHDLSEGGIHAIQGRTETVPKPNSDLQEKQDYQKNLLQREAAEETAISVSEPSDMHSKVSRKRLYNDLCGTYGEVLCAKGTDSVSLDNSVKNNFEVFDTMNDDEIASVKSHVVGNEKTAIGNYATDLRKSLGLVEAEKLDKSMESLWAAKLNPDSSPDLFEKMPPAIREAESPEELRQAMVDSSALRVPSDHVGKVHEYLDRVVPKNPELYGIPENLPEEEFQTRLDDLKNHVRSIANNVTSHDMRVAAKAMFQKKLGWI